MAANDLQNINKLYGIPGSGVPSYGTPALGGSGSKDQAYINQMYDAALSGQKTQLEQNYTQNQADLDRSQEQAQKKAHCSKRFFHLLTEERQKKNITRLLTENSA